MRWYGLVKIWGIGTLILTFWMGQVVADEKPNVVIMKNACPGEGCIFGAGKVLKPTKLFEKPSIDSKLLVTLAAGEAVEGLTGELHMVAGIARVKGTMPKRWAEVDVTQPLEILDYVGEGWSKVRQGKREFSLEIDREVGKSSCPKLDGPGSCEVEVIRAPSPGDWWVQLKARGGKVTGWSLIKGNLQMGADLG